MITIKGTQPNMIANNLTPYRPTHPGEVIREEIEYRGISQRKLAAQMEVSHTVINEILNGKRSVSTEMALLFEAALGIDAETIINMQTRYNIQTARNNNTLSVLLERIRKSAAVL